MGFVFVLKGNYEKAIELCEKAMNLNPESALAPFAIGVVSDMEGDLDRAIGFYEKALAISPESAILCHILSASYSEREHGADRDKAQELFVKVKSVNPGYEGTFNMGKGYINIGEYDKSILLLKAAALLGHDIARRFLERKNITW
jgi:tetratricopeptide (TPR) repeat protein